MSSETIERAPLRTPIVPPSGPLRAPIFILGEAPGSEESDQGRPFVGPSGQELLRMLRTVGVRLEDCRVANVFSRQPPHNAVEFFGGRKGEGVLEHLGPLTTQPHNTYLLRQHAHYLVELETEISRCNPNVILALGNTAAWALGLGQGISNIRGNIYQAKVLGQRYKVVPTFHPAAILRQWPLRVVAIADMEKARNESLKRQLEFDNTEIWIQPTWEDIVEFGERYIEGASILSTDVETKYGQITCLSLTPQPPTHSLVIPFWQEGFNPHYWPTIEEEVRAWKWVQRWIDDPSIVKVTQNGLYDMMYFRNPHKMNPAGFSEDTMLIHHSLYSELRKGLGMIATTHANVPAWKHLRTFKKEEALKRDD